MTDQQIEKAAWDYAKDAYYPAPDYGWYESDDEQMKEVLENTFKAGASITLGKQEKDADIVIQGWVCRDKKDNALNLHAEKPYRAQSGYDISNEPDWWESDCASFLPLDKCLFPDLTWDDDPLEVELIIKRKKK